MSLEISKLGSCSLCRGMMSLDVRGTLGALDLVDLLALAKVRVVELLVKGRGVHVRTGPDRRLRAQRAAGGADAPRVFALPHARSRSPSRSQPEQRERDTAEDARGETESRGELR